MERIVVREGAGRLVAGRYRLDHPVGDGGMGVVWRAIDERLDRVVALKQLRLPPGLDDRRTEQARQRMLREARIAARLQHPGAVAVYDVTDDAGGPVLVMEYLPSRSLAEVLDERGALPPHDVAAIGSRAAAALAAAHGAGIVHRDVKPGNILLGDNGATKITDFGISHATGDVTVTNTGLLGTPAYLAPEVARGEAPSPASDVFSLGSTLFAAVEGTPPFGTADNAVAQLHRAAAGNPPAPNQAGPLTESLMRMLDDNPAARPEMGQVATDLAAIAAAIAAAVASDPAPVAASAQTMALPIRTTAAGAVGGLPATRVDLPPVSPVPPSPASPPSRLSPPSPHAGSRHRPLFLVAGLLVCLLLAVLLAVVLTSPDHGSPNGGAAGTSSGGGRTSPTQPATVAAADPAVLDQAVTSYYGLLPHNTDEAWSRLGPGLQAQGRDSYNAFWHDIKDVQITTAPQASGDTVTVTLRFTTADRGRIQETHRLGMLMRDGRPLINTDQLVSSQTLGDNGDGGGDSGAGKTSKGGKGGKHGGAG